MTNNNEFAKASTSRPEPWLRGTKQEVLAVPRAVLHALELAQEDLQRWCRDFTDVELQTPPLGLPPLAFHLRHIPGSIDRLLTYAESRALSSQQLADLKSESDAGGTTSELFARLTATFATAEKRILALASADYESARTVGKKALPTTVGGLLVHIADHTQRHVGQAITTAKLLTAMRERQDHSPDSR